MVSEDIIKRVAKLSRINLTSKEISKFKKDFDEVLDYFSVLETADVSDIEEPEIITIKEFDDTLREDEPIESNLSKESISISHHKKDNYFK